MPTLLILGEGNFSYTNCISTDPEFKNFKIISTSIDSESELEKYSEFKYLKKRILRNQNIELKHQVNALEIQSIFNEKLDVVQWNHPHLVRVY
jgi:hypothetical protein